MMEEVVVGKLSAHPEWGTSKHIVCGFIRLYGEDGIELSRRKFSNRYNRAIIIGHWMSMFGRTLNGKYYTIEPDYEEF